MMRLFRKKAKPDIKVKTVLCIPGSWKDRSEIVTAIASKNLGDFIFAGKTLFNLKTNIGFEIEIFDRDDRMKDLFKYAGMVNMLSDEYLELIDRHVFVVYIIGETGDLQKAKSIAEAGLAVLKSGGIGIKVETSGKAFNKEHWTDLIINYHESNLYKMFVQDSISDVKGTTYSCGMHNLGFKDTIISGEKFQESVDLISTFGFYQLIDKPSIVSNQTFSSSADSPIFQIIEEENQPYKGHELFGNPFGMWRLKRK